MEKEKKPHEFNLDSLVYFFNEIEPDWTVDDSPIHEGYLIFDTENKNQIARMIVHISNKKEQSIYLDVDKGVDGKIQYRCNFPIKDISVFIGLMAGVGITITQTKYSIENLV